MKKIWNSKFDIIAFILIGFSMMMYTKDYDCNWFNGCRSVMIWVGPSTLFLGAILLCKIDIFREFKRFVLYPVFAALSAIIIHSFYVGLTSGFHVDTMIRVIILLSGFYILFERGKESCK